MRLVFCPVGENAEKRRRTGPRVHASVYLNSSTVADGLNSFSIGGGSSSQSGGVKLVDWDSMAALQRDEPGYPGLTAHSERNLVQDVLREIEDLITQTVDQAAIGAANSFGAIQRKLHVRSARPTGGALGYVQLVEKVEALRIYMNDSQTSDEYSKRELASEKSLPISVFKQAFDIIEDGLVFACAFDEYASLLLTGYKRLLEQHRRGLRRYADACPDKMNGTTMLSSLTDMCQSYQSIASYCIREGYSRGVAAQKASATSYNPERDSSVMQEVLKATQAALAGINAAAKEGKQTGKGSKSLPIKTEHEDAALSRFKYNGNDREEEAADLEKIALAHLRKIQTMPETPSIRKSTLSKSLCQFHWDPSASCRRGGACRFAHLTPSETANLGITDEEVRSALRMRS